MMVLLVALLIFFAVMFYKMCLLAIEKHSEGMGFACFGLFLILAGLVAAICVKLCQGAVT